MSKKKLLFAGAVVVAGLLSSCGDSVTAMDTAYNCAVVEYSYTGSMLGGPLGDITSYIQSKGAPYGLIIKSGSGYRDNDIGMQRDLDAGVAKLSKSELDAMMEPLDVNSVNFVYTCSRACEKNADEVVLLNGFSYSYSN
jgi:hypothetical protein